MGANVLSLANDDGELSAVCGVDPHAPESNIPVYKSFDGVKEKIDVIVDFSSPAALRSETEWAVKHNVPVILASTGYTESDIKHIENCAKKIAVFRTGNFSLGINLLQELVKRAAEVLGEKFDIEIIAQSVKEGRKQQSTFVYGRQGLVGERNRAELGIHAVRGGTIVGEHEVMFAGEDEIITLSHSARSKRVFAAGALKAAKWIVGKPAGLYDMNDLLKNI